MPSDSNEAVPCPYKSLPASSYWRKAVAGVAPDQIDPVVAPKFTVSATDRVATAGSCFAQHIARFMTRSGFSYLVTESGHPVLPPDLLAAYNFGTFSARYGNIYTTRQLLQMLERAYGLRQPVDDVWAKGAGFVDPFRPFIQPGGFASLEEFRLDRAQHFAAIREIVETADVFVFTLGLTEAWENTNDGTVYAICPGCGEGEHHPGRSRFRNFGPQEVIADLFAAIDFMTERNPAIRILLTVSPVPLIATFEPQHVLVATTYSKSVLRVATQAAIDRYGHVDYFPSYEIITSAFSRGAYFAADLREVEEIGVAHAMRCFSKNYLGARGQRTTASTLPTVQPADQSLSAQVNRLVCDEERLEDI